MALKESHIKLLTVSQKSKLLMACDKTTGHKHNHKYSFSTDKANKYLTKKATENLFSQASGNKIKP